MNTDKKIKQIIADQLESPKRRSPLKRALWRIWGPIPRYRRTHHGDGRRIRDQISDEDAEKLLTVQDTLDYIKNACPMKIVIASDHAGFN